LPKAINRVIQFEYLLWRQKQTIKKERAGKTGSLLSSTHGYPSLTGLYISGD